MGFGGASAAKVEELIEAAHSVTDALVNRKSPFRDFWSAIDNKITVANAATDLTFPSIVIEGLASGITITRVVLMLIIRAVKDTSGAANYIEGANKTLRVKKSTGSWGTDDLVGITFDQNSLYVDASTKEAGPAIIGSHDIKAEVDGDTTYNIMSVETLPVASPRADAIDAKGDSLELYDVQVGLRVYFL